MLPWEKEQARRAKGDNMKSRSEVAVAKFLEWAVPLLK